MCGRMRTQYAVPSASTKGSIMSIFEGFVAQLEGGWYLESGLSVADIQLANMVDIHLPLFPIHMKAFPKLTAHHARVFATPEIEAYCSGAQRPANFWGSDWLQARGGKGWLAEQLEGAM